MEYGTGDPGISGVTQASQNACLGNQGQPVPHRSDVMAPKKERGERMPDHTRDSFQLEALRDAAKRAMDANIPPNQRFSYLLSCLRTDEAHARKDRRYKQALWYRLLVADLAFATSARAVRSRLMRALGTPTLVSNTGVNPEGDGDG